MKKKIELYYKVTKEYLTKKYEQIKEYLLCAKNRKKNLTFIAVAITINLFLLIASSNAYYRTEGGLVLLHGIIGDLNTNNNDFVLKIFLEKDEVNLTKEYKLSNNVPEYGYNYSRYSCKNNSILSYDNNLKRINVDFDTKEICEVYFDLESHADVIININLEKDVNSNDYEKSEIVPYYGYSYDRFECTNNGNLEYNNNLHTFSVNTFQKDYCNIYFKKNNTDINVDLYVEDNLNSNNYNKLNSIPSNVLYTINDNKSVCKNNDNNIIDSNITYVNGQINIATNSISNCSVYLDVSNE